MFKLTCSFYSPPRAEKIAIYMLNLIASVTGIRFRRVNGQADIVYGGVSNSNSFYIPYREMDKRFVHGDIDSWYLHEDGELRIALPKSIKKINIHNNEIDFDIFSVMFNFLQTALSVHNKHLEFFRKFKNDDIFIPPVFDDYISYFLQVLKSCQKLPNDFKRKSPWPEEADFALGISHDIDIFKRKIPGSVAILMKSLFSNEVPGGVRGSLKGLFKSVSTALTGETNPYSAIEKWFDIESENTFFIHAGVRRSVEDPTYDPEDIRRVLVGLGMDGIEIGLHNSIGSWTDKEDLKEQKDRLMNIFNTEIEGIRPHYLDCRYPDYWRNAESFKYSSSVGSDAIAGFTCGINFPFFGFDFDTANVLDILEIPIGLMDCALFSICEKTSKEKTIDKLIDICVSNHGLLVLDWHTRTVYEPDFPGWFDTYCMILKKAKSAGAFIAPLGKISSYWKNHCTSFFLS